MRCCTRGKAAQKRRDEEIKQAAVSATSIISTSFVRDPPDVQDTRTIIYIWGRKDNGVEYCRSLIYENAVFEDTNLNGLQVENALLTDDLKAQLSTLILDQSSEGPSQSRIAITQQPQPLPKSWSREKSNKTTEGPEGALKASAGHTDSAEQSETVPIKITSLSRVRIVGAACGDTHLLLLSSLGDVYAFGVGRSGQLGLGEEQLFVNRPEKITRLAEVVQIAAGANHSVALTADGIVYAWGDTENVGDASGVDRPFPSKIPKTSSFHERVTLVAAGFFQTMALTDSNKLFVWGETFFSHYYTTPHCHQRFPPNETIVQLSIGRQFALALSEAGRVFAWGDGTYCELGRLEGADWKGGAVSTGALIPTEMSLIDQNGEPLPKIVSIATGARHSLLLSENGRVFSFGDNLCGQCGIPLHSVRFDTPKVRKHDNRCKIAIIWLNVKIQAGDAKLQIKTIAAGLRHSAAITANHQLVLWGHSAHHKLIHTAPTVTLLEERFGVGAGHMGVAVKSGLKDCCPKPRLVYSLLHQKVSCICLGDEYTVVITGDGCADSSVSSTRRVNREISRTVEWEDHDSRSEDDTKQPERHEGRDEMVGEISAINKKVNGTASFLLRDSS